MSGDPSVRVYLGIGSNIGEREMHLRESVQRINALECITVVEVSSVYETEPWGFTGQGPFLNCVVCLETDTTPEVLFNNVKRIEKDMGRTEAKRNHPRIIDIDILLFGSLEIHTPELSIPHPSMLERRFVLVPLAELAPTLRHPHCCDSITSLLAVCPDKGQIRKTDIQLA